MKSHQDYLKEISAAGLSQKEIGERLGKTQSWVSAAMCSVYSDLKWNDGQAIRRLHADLYPNPNDALPDATNPETEKAA